MVDELDLLQTTKQAVLYNLFDWPRSPNSPLILIAIANTMDLPEKVFTRKIKSRVGQKRIVFNAYNVNQLKEIINTRLNGSKIINEDAIEFCARKVNNMNGDARRALDICRHAIATLEEMKLKSPSDSKFVTLDLIKKVCKELFDSSIYSIFIQNFTLHEILALLCIRKRSHLNGLPETSFIEVRFLNYLIFGTFYETC
jgi:Cdc6-like AAA superfamily ATPase